VAATSKPAWMRYFWINFWIDLMDNGQCLLFWNNGAAGATENPRDLLNLIIFSIHARAVAFNGRTRPLGPLQNMAGKSNWEKATPSCETSWSRRREHSPTLKPVWTA
jgi:hypothetical protein